MSRSPLRDELVVVGTVRVPVKTSWWCQLRDQGVRGPSIQDVLAFVSSRESEDGLWHLCAFLPSESKAPLVLADPAFERRAGKDLARLPFRCAWLGRRRRDGVQCAVWESTVAHAELVDTGGGSATLCLRVAVPRTQVAVCLQGTGLAMGKARCGRSQILRDLLGASHASFVRPSAQFREEVEAMCRAVPHGLADFLRHRGSRTEEAPEPKGLTVSLHPHQRRALRWMLDQEASPDGVLAHLWQGPLQLGGCGEAPVRYSPLLDAFAFDAALGGDRGRRHRGGFLCEEMGLGKTVEIIALILANPRGAAGAREVGEPGGATLVVCPVSVVGQWVSELRDKTGGSLVVRQHHGESRGRDAAALATSDVVVTTYGTVAAEFRRTRSPKRTHQGDPARTARSPLHDVLWRRVILDESQNARGPSQQSTACCALRSPFRWCVSATPACTSLEDYVGQLDFLGLSPLGCRAVFTERCGAPFKSGATTPQLVDAMAMLRALTMRHAKEDTEQELPALSDEVVQVELAAAERKLYDDLERRAAERAAPCIRKRASIQLVAELARLRRACSGVAWTRTRGDPAPLRAPTPRRPPGDDLCAVCQGEFEDAVETPCMHWFCLECISTHKASAFGANGCPVCRAPFAVGDLLSPAAAEEEPEQEAVAAAATATNPTASIAAKLVAIADDAERERRLHPDASFVIFSDFLPSLVQLSAHLTERGFNCCRMTGDMPLARRTESIALFRDGARDVILTTFRSCGAGVDLNRASFVYFADVCVNPGLCQQAVGRAHRLGQKRPVRVKRFVVRDSAEARAASAMAKGGRARSGWRLEPRDWESIFGLRRAA